MLKLDVQTGDSLIIDEGRIVLHFEKKKGQMARVGVDADRSIPVRLAPRQKKEPLRRLTNTSKSQER